MFIFFIRKYIYAVMTVVRDNLHAEIEFVHLRNQIFISNICIGKIGNTNLINLVMQELEKMNQQKNSYLDLQKILIINQRIGQVQVTKLLHLALYICIFSFWPISKIVITTLLLQTSGKEPVSIDVWNSVIKGLAKKQLHYLSENITTFPFKGMDNFEF